VTEIVRLVGSRGFRSRGCSVPGRISWEATSLVCFRLGSLCVLSLRLIRRFFVYFKMRSGYYPDRTLMESSRSREFCIPSVLYMISSCIWPVAGSRSGKW
jgi:hypothetical protein